MMKCHRRAVYYVCDRPLTGRCVETTTTTLSSLPTARRFHGNSSSSSSSSCVGCRSVLVSSPVLLSSSSSSRRVVALYLVWICMIVAVAAPDLPRSRSRSQFRFWTQRPVAATPQDARVTTCHRSTPPPRLSSSSSTRSPAAMVEGGRSRMAVAFTLPPRTPRPRPTTRLSKILEYNDVRLPETSIRRPQSRSKSDILHRPNAEIIAGIRLRSVPAADFRLHLRSVRSYRDVIRLFVRSDVDLRDEDIDSFLSAPSPNSRSGDNDSLPVNGHDRAMAHVFEMEEKGVCREPMAKFIQIRHHELASPESNYVPECTVVYRCHKDYGCCNSTSECGVKTSAYIYRTFWELTCDPGSNCTVFEFPKVKTLRFVNHTECECKPIRHLPRCKLCPHPFEFFRREELGWCNCTCHPNNQVCLDTETGRIPVETQQANCIKESNCERPHCQYGEYDVQMGYCPCPLDNPGCRSTSQGQGNGTDAGNSTAGDLEATGELQTSTGQQNRTTNGQQVTNVEQQTTSEQQTTNATESSSRI